MVALSNTCEGTNAATVTNANTGGPNQYNTISVTGTGTTCAFDNAHVHGGSTAIKNHLAAVASTVYHDWSSASVGSAVTDAYCRMYLYLTAYPTVTTRLVMFQGGVTMRSNLQITTTGTIRTINTAGGVSATTTAVVPLNAWCRIEFDTTGITTTATLSARMFSGANLEKTTPDTNGSISTAGVAIGGTIDDVRWGQSAAVTMTTAWDAWYDDVAFSSVATPGSSVLPRALRMVGQAVNRAASF